MRLRHFFAIAALFSCLLPCHAEDWPQWLGPKRDSIWREDGVLKKFPAGGPKVLWRAPIGAGYSGPVVAKGQVFVTDRRNAEGAANPADPFQRGVIPGKERVLCLKEADGKVVWKHEYDCPYTMSYPAGPRVAPLVSDGKVYSLGAEGLLLCLDSKNGKVVWSHDFKKDYYAKTPMWGFAGHPLLDGPRLICIVGGENATVVAFDKDNGKEIWKALNAKDPGYSSPVLCEQSRKRQLIIWHPESVNSLEPETGKVFWSEPFTSRMNVSIATPRQDGERLFVTTFYNGSLMLKVDYQRPAATVLWRTRKASETETTHLNSILCTPFIENGYIYGVCSYGQLRCLKADTGQRVWETFKATTAGEPIRWANAFIVKNGDRFFLFNDQGDLIIAKMTPAGYEELSRAHLLEPTNSAGGRSVVWSHPAFANRHIYARNDKEIICANLTALR
jgi:outer membrane protein assembly factor BamB